MSAWSTHASTRPDGSTRSYSSASLGAAGRGDMDGLLALLGDDVVMHTDGGGKASALPLPIYGPAKVARASVFGLTRLNALHPLQRVVEVNGEPGIVSYVEGRPQSVFTIEVAGGRIR